MEQQHIHMNPRVVISEPFAKTNTSVQTGALDIGYSDGAAMWYYAPKWNK